MSSVRKKVVWWLVMFGIPFSLFLCALMVLFFVQRAKAEDLPKPQPVVTVGVFEVLGVAKTPQHFGVYGTVLGGAVIPVDPVLTLAPLGGFGFCPETGSWGGAGFLIFDLFLKEYEVHSDPGAFRECGSRCHSQRGDWRLRPRSLHRWGNWTNLRVPALHPLTQCRVLC